MQPELLAALATAGPPVQGDKTSPGINFGRSIVGCPGFAQPTARLSRRCLLSVRFDIIFTGTCEYYQRTRADFVFWIRARESAQQSSCWLSSRMNNSSANTQIAIKRQKSPRWILGSGIFCARPENIMSKALQKGRQRGDNLAVGWAKPGQPTTAPSEVIPGEVLSPWTGGPAVASVQEVPVHSVLEPARCQNKRRNKHGPARC